MKEPDFCQDCHQSIGTRDAFEFVMKHFWTSYQVQGDELSDQIKVAKKLIELGFEEDVPNFIRKMKI